MMKSNLAKIIAFALVMAAQPAFPILPQGAGREEFKPSPLTRTDAEILVYISPDGQSLRSHGFDIGWDRDDVYVTARVVSLHAYGTKPIGPQGGSASAGNFSVDRYTARVRIGDETVHSAEMDGVARIMLAAHGLPVPR